MPRPIPVLVCAILTACLALLPCAAPAQDHTLEAGWIAFDDAGTGRITNQTLSIPLRTDADFYWGVILTPQDSEEHTLTIVLRLPSPPQDIGSGWSTAVDDNQTLTGAVTGTGPLVAPVSFDQADPLGQWVMDVYLDGRHLDTLRFEVTAKE